MFSRAKIKIIREVWINKTPKLALRDFFYPFSIQKI